MLARALVEKRNAWIIVGIVLVLTVLAAVSAGKVTQEDDILAFLPAGNPEIEHFYEINREFGGLDVAIVGIEAPEGGPFDATFLSRLRDATEQIPRRSERVEYALSLATVRDFTKDEDKGGIKQGPLIDALPTDAASEEALKAKVMSRDLVVGNLIAKDASAVTIYAFGAYGAEPRALAADVRAVVDEYFPDATKYWGGAPFISGYIFETVQEDMANLTPWAVIAIIFLIVLAFRDLIGSFLVLVSTGMGILMSIGVMGILGVNYNIVLGSMPIILFAVGSAYGIHVLARYYTLTGRLDRELALTTTLKSVGPTVLAAGLTTVAGLASFVTMDIEPMRIFGIFTALGILATLILSLTFVPAVIRLTGIKREGEKPGLMARATATLVAAARRHRHVVMVLLLAVAVAGGAFTGKVDARVDQSAFFAEGSPPDQADQFMNAHFGGAEFIQIHLEGDMRDPTVLREVRRMADTLYLLPGVNSTIHIGQIVSEANEAMESARRVPDSREKVQLLLGFLTGDPSVGQVVTPKRDQGLVHLKLGRLSLDDKDVLLAAVEKYAADTAIRRYQIAAREGADVETLGRIAARSRDIVSLRIRALGKQFGVPLNKTQQQALDDYLRGGKKATLELGPVEEALVRFMGTEECWVEFPEAGAGALKKRIAAELAKAGPEADEKAIDKALKAAVGDVEDGALLVDDLFVVLGTPLEEIWVQQAVAQRAPSMLKAIGVTPPGGPAGERFVNGVGDALIDLDAPTAMLPAGAGEKGDGGLSVRVNGLPVLHRGLSRSVTSNQLKSLGLALSLVLIIMVILFRSLWSGLLATTPMVLTLLLVYGGMGAMGLHLDIGTSMLASLIIGAGVDYAVHFTAEWRAPDGQTLDDAAAHSATWTGPAIWTNAVMVAVGFAVLTLGDAKPLRNVGGLTAASMIAAAVATFFAIPALARKLRYRRAELPETLGH